MRYVNFNIQRTEKAELRSYQTKDAIIRIIAKHAIIEHLTNQLIISNSNWTYCNKTPPKEDIKIEKKKTLQCGNKELSWWFNRNNSR